MTSDFIEHAARYAYEDAYPGKPWGMADTFTASMFKQKAAYYAPAFGKIISAAEAERDAALEHLATATYRTREYEDAMITEGERRATAAIVAWLQAQDGMIGGHPSGALFTILAGKIERGDHITEATPVQG